MRHWMTSQSQILADYERRSDISLEDGERILRELQVTFCSLCFTTTPHVTCIVHISNLLSVL